ncbi:Laminin subunit alphmethyl-accepting chemotaxis sensory transducer [Pseudomonas putida]|uniref:Laminin subunit alphmethyl-accepting chemotaxis sensory transducer n=2 Tax=Pseudomonas putida TaxID=303 RepID=A0A1L7NFB3_PSEPU|nr:methyl-accepting chemotaxis protein [Pseudomonas putida]BAW24134.1 Laminin subunit alphmethyl-accepting chemotaxis sensory transducer [Pseudomonas putida]
MLQTIKSYLGNLSVGRKLMLAFGLVTALSLVAITIAFQAAKTLLSGSQQNQAIAEINLLLLKARGAEKDFALSNESPSVERLDQALKALNQTVEALRIEAAIDPHELRNIAVSVQDYRKQFKTFVDDSQGAKNAFEDMQKQAEEARIQFEFVELDMFSSLRESLTGEGTLNSDTLTFSESASSLLRKLLAVRNRESIYVQSGAQQSLKEWEELMQGTEGEVSLLHTRIGKENKDILQAADDALTNYRIAFQNYKHSRIANENTAKKMRELAERVLQLADSALSSHKLAMEKQAAAVLRLLLISGIVIMCLALLAGWAIRQLILPPLRQTLEMAKSIASGDLSQVITTERQDELGQLCQAMGTMSMGLRNLVEMIIRGIDQLHISANQLKEASMGSRDGALTQQREAEQAATATQQMAYSADAVSRHASEASAAAILANHQANDGAEVVRQSADQIARVAIDVEQSMKTIRELHDGSGRIGGVLDVIKAVAEQTNLLALNAAIEAARAGEQGRGFAVVADEVRALARRTQDSTRTIESMIIELQAMSDRAVQQMSGSSQLSQEAATYGEQARMALSRITSAVSSIETFNQQIATAAEEQSSVAGEISNNVQRVRNIADQGAVSTERMTSASAELAQLGEQLQQLVRKFRI